MKLSFSLTTKPSSGKPQKITTTNTAEEDPSSNNKEYLTEFDRSKQTLNPSSKPIAAIPPIPNSNEWRTTKKMKNLANLPTESDDPNNNLQFMVDPTTLGAAADDPNFSYGLNLRSAAATTGTTDNDAKSSKIDNLMLQRFKQNMRDLPDDLGQEEFESMPVENFASALLAGYGWVEGKGIGRNAKEDVKVVEYKRRTAKEGLGFVGELPQPPTAGPARDKEKGVSNGNGKLREGESKRGGYYESNGNGKLRDGGSKGGEYYVGKDVRIVGGGSELVGLKGRIVEVKTTSLLVLKISRSGEEVTVRVKDIADLGSKEDERCLRKLKELKIHGSKQDKKSKKSHRESSDRKRKGGEGEELRDESKGSDLRPWLSSHIRVRIVSKELKGGRLYLKKGVVVDVVGPTACDLSMDESRELIQGVDQEFLETALPRPGGPVLVLCGKHKGVYGILVEKDTENETAVVRDADNHAMINVRLEEIAEYIGDPSDIGY